MTTNYRRGYQFERKVKKKLESAGHLVVRSGGSKIPDLVVITPTSRFLVECKKSGRLTQKEKNKYLQIQKKYGLIAYLAFPGEGDIIFEGI